MYDDEPELAGYEPGEYKPLRSRGFVIAIRVVVILAVVALILPGIITTLMFASTSAQEACRRWVRYEDPSATGARSAFELFGAHGTGWQCYSSGAFGGDQFIASLGLIPGPPNIPRQRLVTS